MSRGTLDPAVLLETSDTGLSPSFAGLSSAVLLSLAVTSAVRTPPCTHSGLGSSGFARRYSRNRCFFLFLRLLRCFSSPGSLPYVMDWRMDDGGLLHQVSPFRYLRINGYLLLPEAFRSLSRLSSALSAKAFTLRSSCLDQSFGSLWGFLSSVTAFPFFISFLIDVIFLNKFISKSIRLSFDVQFSRCSL